MSRLLISGLALLLGAAILVRIACTAPAPAAKANPLVFVFLRVDRDQNLAILRPMIAPDIGVQLDSGSTKLETHSVLQCHATTRDRNAVVENQPGKITETLLDCGDRKFIVKALDFSPQR